MVKHPNTGRIKDGVNAIGEQLGDNRSVLERHVQTILVAILIGLVGWVGVSVSQSREAIARQQVQLGYMAEQLKNLHDSVSDMNYGVLDARLNAVEYRVDKVEKECLHGE